MKKYNENLLLVKSPKTRVRGPWAVIRHDVDNHLGVVALTWDKDPRLGIRWVDKNGAGYPNPRGNPAWHILHPHFNDCILDHLEIQGTLRKNVDAFLAGNMPGKELKSKS